MIATSTAHVPLSTRLGDVHLLSAVLPAVLSQYGVSWPAESPRSESLRTESPYLEPPRLEPLWTESEAGGEGWKRLGSGARSRWGAPACVEPPSV
jgi:hypothetical protein